MARETGRVFASRDALVSIRISGGEQVECLIDTGFDGGLVLPRALTERFALPIVATERVRLAGGVEIVVDIARADVEWLGIVRPVEVIVGDGDDLLLGTGLLAGAVLTIDYVALTSTITN